ncbi:hypothetical protein [Hydrogenobacter thermophilus]|uniref:hypothetical protein n=1 Tax=Hydrogenobacter thermophilus TaxID=940 RepID=UPI0030F656D1
MHTQLEAKTLERCKSLIQPIRKAHYWAFGLDFPYWFSVGQAQVESQCRHNVMSTDGIGSEGFAQITYKLWKDKLRQAGIIEIKSIEGHAKAQAFILKYEFDRTVCKKLFEMYQRYNGGELVSKELMRARSCRWEDGYKACRRGNVCVLRTGKECRQYRNACEINYEYAVKVHGAGLNYWKGEAVERFEYF